MKGKRSGDRACEGTVLFRERAKGMSRVELARQLGVNRSQVTDWLGGHRRPSVQHAKRIEALIGIPFMTWFPDTPANDSDASTGTDQ